MQEENQRTQADMEQQLQKLLAQLLEGPARETMNAKMDPRFEECSFEERSCILSYETRHWMANPMGNFHGGMMATAMDITMGINTYYWCGCRFTPTISMTLNFVRPVPLEKRLFIRSIVSSAGRTTEFVTAEAWMEGEADKIVATATGVYHVVQGPCKP